MAAARLEPAKSIVRPTHSLPQSGNAARKQPTPIQNRQSKIQNRAGRAALALFCICLLAYGYFVARGPHNNPDSRLALTYSIVERGAVDIDPYAGTTQDRAYVNGHWYSDKAPGISLVLVPVYAALQAVGGSALDTMGEAPGMPDRFFTRYLLTFLGIGMPAACLSAAFFKWLGRREPRISPRLAVAAGYALGTPAFAFSAAAFGHVPAGICLFASYCLLGGSSKPGTRSHAVRQTITTGALLAAAVAIEYPAAIAAVVVCTGCLWGTARWRRDATLLAAGAVPIALCLLAYQWVAFGSLLDVGYAHLAVGSSFAEGQATGVLGVGWPNVTIALELLAGPHRGLVLHAPWLVLSVPGALLLWRRGERRRVAIVAGVFVTLLAINSGYAFWDGGASWGPRHLVPSLPFLALLALPAAARWPRTAWSLVGVSVALNLAAVATRALVDSGTTFPIRDFLIPAISQGRLENNWGMLFGLSGWSTLLPLISGVLFVALWAAPTPHPMRTIMGQIKRLSDGQRKSAAMAAP